MEVEDVIRQYVVTLPRNVDILDTQKGSFACPQVDPNLIPTNHQYRRLAITKNRKESSDEGCWVSEASCRVEDGTLM